MLVRLLTVFVLLSNGAYSENRSAQKAELFPEIPEPLCSSLLSNQKSQWLKLSKPLVIKSPKAKYSADLWIGGSGASVYLDSKKNVLLKLYVQNHFLALYEQRVTEFLLSVGEKVPPVVEAFDFKVAKDFSQPLRELRAGWYNVVVKKYFEGLTTATAGQVKSRSLKQKLSDSLQQRADYIRSRYFGEQPGQFFDWLKLHYPQEAERFSHEPVTFNGDTKENNFLYMPGEGWVLFDP